jgi:hypothetical protein
MWGDPKSDTAMSAATGLAAGQVEPAVFGGPFILPEVEKPSRWPIPPQPVEQEYAGPRKPGREKHCVAKNDTCMGWAMEGSDLCSGHAGRMLRRPREPR